MAGEAARRSGMLRRISLANKCLLLFGLAVVAIVAAALTVAWFRMNAMVDEAEFEQARQVGAVYEVMWREQVRAGAANPAAGSRIVVSGDAVEFVPAGAAGNGEGGGPGRAVSGFASEAFAAFSGDQRLRCRHQLRVIADMVWGEFPRMRRRVIRGVGIETGQRRRGPLPTQQGHRIS